MELLTYNKTTVWLRVPASATSHKILMVPRATLPHGMAKAATLEVEMGPITNRGLDEDFIPLSGWTADIEVLRVAS